MIARQFVIGVSVGTCLLVAGAISARAAVMESNASGFAVEEKIHIAASPAAVYAALIHPESWWNSEHTFSGSASNLALDPKAGGCFCETLPGGGSVQHLTVAMVIPGKAIELRGAMGPFLSQGVEGALTFTLAAKDGGTDLVLDNNVGGFIKGGMAKWPMAADAMLTDLVAHLKFYAENGKSMPANPK